MTQTFGQDTALRDFTGHPEISQLDIAVCVADHVLHLDVSVRHLVVMHVGDPDKELEEVFEGFVDGELAALLQNVIVKLTTGQILQDHVFHRFRLDQVVQLHQVGVGQLPKDGDLTLHSLLVVRLVLQNFHVHNLDRHFVVIFGVDLPSISPFGISDGPCRTLS